MTLARGLCDWLPGAPWRGQKPARPACSPLALIWERLGGVGGCSRSLLPPQDFSPPGGFFPRSGPHLLSPTPPLFCCTDLGAESVSGTLSSLQQCHPRDGFDMFTQTRGSSSAEQRKTYVGTLPVALRGRWAGLTPAWAHGQHKGAFYSLGPGLSTPVAGTWQ